MEKLQITGEFIKLDAALKFANVVSSGGEAKLRIAEGEVTVNGEECRMRGKKLHNGDVFTVNGAAFEVVTATA